MNHPFFSVFRAAVLWGIIAIPTIALAATPLHPEDGSARVTHWTIASRGGWGIFLHDQLKDAFKKEQIQLRILSQVQNEYLQDLGFMSEDGSWVSNARYPSVLGNDELYRELTMNVANEDWGPVYVDPDEATRSGLRVSRQMKITFTEGGALISGRRKNGEAYVIASDGVIDRAVIFSGESRQKATELVAIDLGVSLQNLILVRSSHHLDLLMLATPGEKILLSDPRQNTALLASAIARSNSSAEKKELATLMKESQEIQTTSDWSGTSYRNDLEQLDEMANVLLKAGFTVERFPGFLKRMNSQRETVNFFNGFLGKNPYDQLFFFTNSARTLPSLESAYVERLSKTIAIDPARIYFVGRYNDVAGLDCAGVPSKEIP